MGGAAGVEFLWAQQVPLLVQKVLFFLNSVFALFTFCFIGMMIQWLKGVCFSQLLLSRLCSFGDLMLCFLVNLHGCATEISCVMISFSVMSVL